MKKMILLLVLSVCLSALSGCAPTPEPIPQFSAGFAIQKLEYGDLNDYYIAGYHNGQRPTGVIDGQSVSALWLDNNVESILLISVDCVGLSSATVGEIRQKLQGFCRETGCSSINVVATHTHAGVDTLGLWGPVGIDGKNADFMEQLVEAAASVAKAAYSDRTPGQLSYSKTETQQMQLDSREPLVYDSNLYQLHFVPDDAAKPGIRVLSYAAHAEALRGENRLLSADFPGQLRQIIDDETGDRVLFLPGAVGGLIMIPEFSEDALHNLQKTGSDLSDYALNPENSRILSPDLQIIRHSWETPMDNTLFLYYKFLGILGNSVRQNISGQYLLQTELTLITLGDVTLALLPGEIFPELVTGTGNADDPEALADIAARYGIDDLVIVGLANDEIGYIVPPSVFRLDNAAPYVQSLPGHYEETNSLGPSCAADLAAAFEAALSGS